MTITVTEKVRLVRFIKDYSTQQKITTFPSHQNKTYSINYTSISKPEIALSWTELVYPEPPVVKERTTYRYDGKRTFTDFQTEVMRVKPKIIKRAFYLSIDANDDFILRNEANEVIKDIRKWETIRSIMRFVPESTSVPCAYEKDRKASALWAQRLSWIGLIPTGSAAIISGFVWIFVHAVDIAALAGAISIGSTALAAVLGIILIANIHEYSQNPVTDALKPSPVAVVTPTSETTTTTSAAPRVTVTPIRTAAHIQRPNAPQAYAAPIHENPFLAGNTPYSAPPAHDSQRGVASPGVQAGEVIHFRM